MILKCFFVVFLPKYVHFNGLKLRVFLKRFPSPHNFGVQKAKDQRFEENKGFEFSFIELKCKWLQTGLAD